MARAGLVRLLGAAAVTLPEAVALKLEPARSAFGPRPPIGSTAGPPVVPLECGEPMTFSDFVLKFNRRYPKGSLEYQRREAAFNNHLARTGMQNCKPGAPWKATINHLADWTDRELASLRGYKRTARPAGPDSEGDAWDISMFEGGHARTSVVSNRSMEQQHLPTSFSWGNLSAMEETRDQSQCGSCWAFAAETVLRAHSEIYNKVQRFSVEQIISCTPNPRECGGKGGCDGATSELAFEYVLQHGVALEDDVPYEGRAVTCPTEMAELRQDTVGVFTKDGKEVHMIDQLSSSEYRGWKIGMMGWTKLPENKEEPLVRALVEMGPIAIAVSAGFEWNLYATGIMPATDCDQGRVISHAVVLYGYGIDDSAGIESKYWHIKNSWGAWWGEKGNVRLGRLDSEEADCGWDTQPLIGTGCKGGPAQVWVCGSCGILFDAALPHFNPVEGGETPQPQSAW